VTVCLSLYVPVSLPTILSSAAIAGGLYLLFVGFHLLARERSLLAIPISKIGSASPGLVEISGMAAGLLTITAPISGEPCFLYRTTAWQRGESNKQNWEKVAEENLYLPFFINDSTGQLLIEPPGADLDLLRNFHEEYEASFFSSNAPQGEDKNKENDQNRNKEESKEDHLPSRVRAFLLRHGIVPVRRLRIEECSIKLKDALFVSGTLMENPAVQLHSFSPNSGKCDSAMSAALNPEASNHDSRDDDNDSPALPVPDTLAEQFPAPQVIRLAFGAAASGSQQMTQQGKIAAALNRVGASEMEVRSATEVSYASTPVENNIADTNNVGLHELHAREASSNQQRSNEDAAFAALNLTPPIVLRKGTDDSTFVISFRSQKEFCSALARKSAASLLGGAAITLVGVCGLLAQWVILQ